MDSQKKKKDSNVFIFYFVIILLLVVIFITLFSGAFRSPQLSYVILLMFVIIFIGFIKIRKITILNFNDSIKNPSLSDSNVQVAPSQSTVVPNSNVSNIDMPGPSAFSNSSKEPSEFMKKVDIFMRGFTKPVQIFFTVYVLFFIIVFFIITFNLVTGGLGSTSVVGRWYLDLDTFETPVGIERMSEWEYIEFFEDGTYIVVDKPTGLPAVTTNQGTWTQSGRSIIINGGSYTFVIEGNQFESSNGIYIRE